MPARDPGTSLWPMITTVAIEEAVTRLGELLDRADRGEIVIITRDGSAVAQLTACIGDAFSAGASAPDRLVDLFDRCHTGPDSMADVTGPIPRVPIG